MNHQVSNAVADRAASSTSTSSTGERQPLRVLHVINGEFYAGAERVQDLLGLRLPEFGVEIAYACLKPNRFPAARRAQSVPLYELSMRHRFDLGVAWRVAEIAREGGYHAIHAHTARSGLIGQLASGKAGLPFVYHVHSPTARDTTHRLKNWFNVALERFSLRGVARLVTVSRSLGEQMRRQGYAEKLVTVIHNGVPVVEPFPERMPPCDEWTLGTVALIRPRKGIEVLLDSLSLLRKQGHKVRLRAVGPFESAEYEHDLRARAARLGVEAFVDWVGFQSDVNSQLTQMDLLVLPSLFGEGLPMVVLEAMSAGVPVVSTRVEGIPEAIRDGMEGAIAAPSDPEDLARSIERFLRGELDWSAVRNSARARQVAEFSDTSMASRLAEVYREVVGGRTLA